MASDQKLTEDDIRKMSYQHQQMQYQAEAMTQQINMVERSIADSEKAINALTEMEGLDTGHEILVPIGSNTLIRANLAGIDSVIIDIGAGINIEKKPAQAKQNLETRKEELKKYHQNIQSNLEELLKKMKGIEDVVASVSSKQQPQQIPLQGS